MLNIPVDKILYTVQQQDDYYAYTRKGQYEIAFLYDYEESIISVLCIQSKTLVHTPYHGVRHGFKTGGGAKTIIELESEPKFNINLYKII